MAQWSGEKIPLETPTYFVEAVGGYLYRDVGEATLQGPVSSVTRFGATRRAWFAGGRATVPVLFGLGVRATVLGGGTVDGLLGLESESTVVGGDAEVFWRDPTIGRFSVGYGYAWTESSTTPVASTRSNSLPASVSLYLPDLGQGPVDWTVDFRYEWLDVDPGTGPVRQWGYTFVGSSYWYINDIAGFTGGVLFTKRIAEQQSNVLEGVFSIELLLPTGATRYGTISFDAAVGRDELEGLAPPFSTISSITYRVGGTVTVHFPGVDSLLQLRRAYR